MQKLLISCMTLLLMFGVAFAQEPIEIQKILDNPAKYKNEVVVVVGEVQQFIPATTTTSGYYLIKDDWGGIIAVRTTKGSPEVGNRYKIRGPVSYDPDGIGPSYYYISEDVRASFVIPPPNGNGNGQLNWQLILLISVIVILLIIAIILLARKPASSLPQVQKTEGETVKVELPPPGTLKVLPGRFQVTAGDSELKEVRFFKTKKQTEQEITFGRDPSNNPYTHIQLASQTVSRKQAKVIFSNGTYTIINYSSTNPTKVNDAPLGENESTALNDGDKISMGEVEFTYQA